MNLTKKWILSALLGVAVLIGFSACKDKLTLAEVGDELYITITPSAPDLKVYVLGEPVAMTCRVTNYDGQEVKDATVTWSSDNPEVAAFKDGDNKLYGINAGALGRSVKIRATLPNGKYAVTEAFVDNQKAQGLELLTLTKQPEQKTVKKKVTVEGKEVETEVTEWVGAEFAALPQGDEEYLMPASQGQTLEIIVKGTPAALLKQGKLEIDGVDAALLSITEMKLDPVNDAGKIAVTPEGAKWYRLAAVGGRGVANLKFVAGIYDPAADPSASEQDKTADPRSLAYTTNFNVRFGTKVLSMGIVDRPQVEVIENYKFDPLAPKTKSLSTGVDFGVEDEVELHVRVIPAAEIDMQAIEQQLKWQITNASGGGGIISKVFEPETHGDVLVSRIRVKSGRSEGAYTLQTSLQGETVSKSYGVIDVKNLKIEGVTISPKHLDMLVGEKKEVLVDVVPNAAYAFVASEFAFKIHDESIARVTTEEQKFVVEALKTGETMLTVSLRGKSSTIRIKTSPKALEVGIDNAFGETVVMSGDRFSWKALVKMAGADKPIWSLFRWILPQGQKAVSIIGEPVGEMATFAAHLADPTKAESVTITAVYDKVPVASGRVIKVVPVESSLELSPSTVDLSNPDKSYIKQGNPLWVELAVKGQAKTLSSIKFLISSRDGSRPSLGDKTFSAEEYDIAVEWAHTDYQLRKMVEPTSSIKFVRKGGKIYDVIADLKVKVGEQTIKITGQVHDLSR